MPTIIPNMDILMLGPYKCSAFGYLAIYAYNIYIYIYINRCPMSYSAIYRLPIPTCGLYVGLGIGATQNQYTIGIPDTTTSMYLAPLPLSKAIKGKYGARAN